MGHLDLPWISFHSGAVQVHSSGHLDGQRIGLGMLLAMEVTGRCMDGCFQFWSTWGAKRAHSLDVSFWDQSFLECIQTALSWSI